MAQGIPVKNERRTDVYVKAGIAYVPQGRDIFSSLSMQDNLKAAAFGAGTRADDAPAWARIVTSWTEGRWCIAARPNRLLATGRCKPGT